MLMSFGMQKAQKQQSNVNKQQGQIHKVSKEKLRGAWTRAHYSINSMVKKTLEGMENKKKNNKNEKQETIFNNKSKRRTRVKD